MSTKGRNTHFLYIRFCNILLFCTISLWLIWCNNVMLLKKKNVFHNILTYVIVQSSDLISWFYAMQYFIMYFDRVTEWVHCCKCLFMYFDTFVGGMFFCFVLFFINGTYLYPSVFTVHLCLTRSSLCRCLLFHQASAEVSHRVPSWSRWLLVHAAVRYASSEAYCLTGWTSILNYHMIQFQTQINFKKCAKLFWLLRVGFAWENK